MSTYVTFFFFLKGVPACCLVLYHLVPPDVHVGYPHLPIVARQGVIKSVGSCLWQRQLPLALYARLFCCFLQTRMCDHQEYEVPLSHSHSRTLFVCNVLVFLISLFPSLLAPSSPPVYLSQEYEVPLSHSLMFSLFVMCWCF